MARYMLFKYNEFYGSRGLMIVGAFDTIQLCKDYDLQLDENGLFPPHSDSATIIRTSDRAVILERDYVNRRWRLHSGSE